MSKTSINHLTSSDNAITCIDVCLINMIARERECGNIATAYWLFYINYVIFVLYKFIFIHISLLR